MTERFAKEEVFKGLTENEKRFVLHAWDNRHVREEAVEGETDLYFRGVILPFRELDLSNSICVFDKYSTASECEDDLAIALLDWVDGCRHFGYNLPTFRNLEIGKG